MISDPTAAVSLEQTFDHPCSTVVSWATLVPCVSIWLPPPTRDSELPNEVPRPRGDPSTPCAPHERCGKALDGLPDPSLADRLSSWNQGSRHGESKKNVPEYSPEYSPQSAALSRAMLLIWWLPDQGSNLGPAD